MLKQKHLICLFSLLILTRILFSPSQDFSILPLLSSIFLIGITEKKFTVSDIYLAVFLQINGLSPELQNINGRVIFSFPATDELYRLVNAYNSGATAPILDYIITLKNLRSQMYNMRLPVVK